MILAVDLGSTSFKAAIFDKELREVGAGSQPIEHNFAPGGRVELPVREALNGFRGAIQAALQDAGIAVSELEALAIDSQAQTFTVLDSDGQAKRPFISWQDSSPKAACEALAADQRLSAFAEHCSFSCFLPALHICQIQALQNLPSPVIEPGDKIVHLPTFLIHKCSGEAVIDDNLAAMSGLYSLSEKDWWQPALEATRLQRDHLPKLSAVGEIATYTDKSAEQFGLPAGLPIVLAGNDQTAGGYAVQVAEQDAVLITLGTALVAYTAQPHLLAPSPRLVRGPYPGDLSYGLVTDSCGGNIINWARTVVAGGDTNERFFALAEDAEPGCQGLVFNSDLPNGNGAWEHLGLHHTTADMARSVIESLVERLAGLIKALELDDNTMYLVAGGGSKAPLWVKILEERLEAELTVTTANPLLGAARMAVHALA